MSCSLRSRALPRAAAGRAERAAIAIAFFDRDPEAGDLLLRHDVDLSLDAAVQLAELEHEEGAAATYFLMTESVFYNLASTEGEQVLERLRELGHRVGLHAVWPQARARRAASTPSSPGTTRIRSTWASRSATGSST